MAADIKVFTATLAGGPFYCRMDILDEVEPVVRRYQIASRSAMHELRMLILALAVDETGRKFEKFETLVEVRAWLSAQTADDLATVYRCALGAVGLSAELVEDLEHSPVVEVEGSPETTNVVPLSDRHRHR